MADSAYTLSTNVEKSWIDNDDAIYTKKIGEVAAVAQIVENGAKYETLQAAIDAAESGNTVTLLQDVSPDAAIMISKSIIIDGDKHVITSSTNRGFRINNSNVDVTIKDLEISVASVGVEPRAIQIDSNMTGVTLMVDHVTASAQNYTVNIGPGTSNLNVTIKDSTLNGWAAFNAYASNSNYVISGSTLKGVNNFSTSSDNDFATIVFDGGTLAGLPGNAYSSTLTISDSVIIAQENGTNTQNWISFQYGAANNTALVYVTGTTILDSENGADKTAGLFMTGVGNKVTMVLTDAQKTAIEEKNYMVTENGEMYDITLPQPNVYYYWDTGSGQEGTNCYFTAPFTNGWLMDGEYIRLEDNVSFSGNVEFSTNAGAIAQTGGSFTLTLGNYSISKGEYSVILPAGVFATTDKMVDIFSAPEGYKVVETNNNDGTYTYSVAQVVNVAQIGSKKYTSLEAAVTDAAAGDTVELLQNIDLPAQVTVDKKLTLDLKGYTISNSVDIWNDNANAKTWSLISVQGGDLTITGNGVLDAKENDCFAADVRDGGKLTIENGTFKGNVSAIYVIEGSATINGGTFSIKQLDPTNKDYRFTLNCFDANRKNGTATITVKGGTFNQFDPSNNLAEGENTNFVAEGYEAVEISDSIWQVGKIQTTEIAQDGTQSDDNTAVFNATKQVISTDGEDTTLSSNNAITVTVSGDTTDVATTTLSQIADGKLAGIIGNVISASNTTSNTLDVKIVVVSDEVNSDNNKITFEVHPEAIAYVNNEKVGSVEIGNDKLAENVSFSITLDVSALNLSDGAFVNVIHKHDNDDEDLGSFVVTNGKITIPGIRSFSEFEVTVHSDDEAVAGYVGASLRRRVKTINGNQTTEVVQSSTDIRFTFGWELPEGCTLSNYSSYFYWNTDNGDSWNAVQMFYYDGNKNEASLVINGVPSEAFGTTIYAKLVLEYVDSESHVHSITVNATPRSVNDVANLLTQLDSNDSSNLKWIDYAKYLKGVYHCYNIESNDNGYYAN